MWRSRRHFVKGLGEAIKTLSKVYYEHPTITSERICCWIVCSWNDDEPNQVFPFLLEQADQGDLEAAKKRYAYERYPEFHQAIDKALETAPPAGSRIISVEKVQHVLEVLAPITNASDEYGPGSIVEEYLLGEKEKTKKASREVQEAGAENHTD